jgi:CRISPR-associated endonuclease Cas1
MTATKNRTANLRSLANPRATGIDATRRPPHFHRLFAPSHGVVVLVGYSIRVHVDRGHLILEDGIGTDRRKGRFPRVHHGLWRVVVIGADGMVSLAALRWMADQNIAFAMLERDGSVILSTGPVAASDTRLRRAQACAQHLEAAVEIVRELIRYKLSGQEGVVRQKLSNSAAANQISNSAGQLDVVNTIDEIRVCEANGASAYWTAWQAISVRFPQSDLARVPEHWRTFGTRRSPISGTSRRAPNPVNAILNYLYTLLESETRLAITALGLDPGFGLLHVDQSNRDSLVYDLMEPIRPKIDLYVLDWIARTPLKRSWFFEERDGSCRLMSPLTIQLADTVPTWSREVAPFVEWFAQAISSTASGPRPIRSPGTRLTRRRRYEAAGSVVPLPKLAPTQQTVCQSCGSLVSAGTIHCRTCSLFASGERLKQVQSLGKVAALDPNALARRTDRMIKQRQAERAWSPSELPSWLDDEAYRMRIQPLLRNVSKRAIELTLQISKRYAYEIAAGEKIPHRRHWVKLAELVGLSDPSS